MMKGKWKLCMICGGMLAFAVLSALLLLNGTMSSADEKLKTFDTSQSVSGSAAEIKEKATEDKKKQDSSSDEITSSFIWSSGKKNKFGKKIASYAEFWEGFPYQYGGAVLPEIDAMSYDKETGWGGDKGVDSSGFIQAVYNYFDIGIPRSCNEQAKIGDSIRIKDIRPGDLIFYGASDDKITHVGIYIGKGKVIHSSSKAGKVIISDMNYRRIVVVKNLSCAIIPGKKK